MELKGLWQRCPPGLKQTHELLTSSAEVIGAADPEVRSRQTSLYALITQLTHGVQTDISIAEEVP